METIKGKYNTIQVYADIVDNATRSQLYTLCNFKHFKNSKIVIMPDCHSGIGCVVGTTMTIVDSVVPNLVGVDIGCGMLAIKLAEKRIDLPAFDSILRANIRASAEKRASAVYHNDNIKNLRCKKNNAPIREELAQASLGTLGSGNHFIELDKDSEGNIWLIIHTGSRHLGIEVCNWYQNQAYKELKFKVNGGDYKTKSEELIKRLKSSKKDKEIAKELKRFKKQYTEMKPDVPFELAYCTGKLMEDYLFDMRIVQEHASLNREKIAEILLKEAKLHKVDSIETIHNYIDIDNMILRKGSVSAQSGERIIIPINMRDGTLLCTGKGNPGWNYSAPHGSGRLFSRSEAKKRFSLAEYKQTMKDNNVYTTSVSDGTLDECPMTYKPIESIMNIIEDTAEVKDILKPIYNYKSSSLDD